ncbi:MAG: IpaD/SipD/SspD family type III secretion system needle tip protein [Enterovibrio sp.]
MLNVSNSSEAAKAAAASASQQVEKNTAQAKQLSAQTLVTISELLETDLMKEGKRKANNDKLNQAINSLEKLIGLSATENMDDLQGLLPSFFADDLPNLPQESSLTLFSDSSELATLKKELLSANKLFKSAAQANESLISGFAVSYQKSEKSDFVKEVVAFYGNEKTAKLETSVFGLGGGPITGVSDMELIGRLNTYLDNLTTVYLGRYQEATDVLTQVYTKFAELNIAISEMISNATVDSEKNTITLDFTVLKNALEKLKDELFNVNGDLQKQLQAITFLPEERVIAEELAQGTGLIVVEKDGKLHLQLDPSSFDNLQKAFDALTDKKNQVSGSTNVVKIPSGMLQAFQTAIESINNAVSSNNQTMIEKLRSVTSQQQQTTQLFSSIMSELFDSNKRFLSNAL